MSITFLLEAFERYGSAEAIIWDGISCRYSDLLTATRNQIESFSELGLAGKVVSLEGDYMPETIAALLALIELKCVVVPLAPEAQSQKAKLQKIAQVQYSFEGEIRPVGHAVTHPLLLTLIDEQVPGLILFTSGTSGERKAILHKADRLLAKYRTPRKAKRSIPFMLFDHIGGVNTLLHILSSGGTVIGLQNRSPMEVCRVIETHRVQVLPTTPSFLNLFLLSEAYEKYDLSSLEILAFGAEPMLASRLERLRAILPKVVFIQNFGMSEVGIMATKSKSSGSLWMKLGGDGYQTRVRDGMLEIKAESAMLGYLNAPSPFTEDGWLRTGDRVEVQGEYLRVLGRASEMINIGGEKVHPAEIEDVLIQMEAVVDVLVSSETNAITGNITVATVQLCEIETRSHFRKRMVEFMNQRVPSDRIPHKVVVSTEDLNLGSLKKKRDGQGG